MLFRLNAMIDEKKLAKVLIALDGLVVAMDPPVPVRNALVQEDGSITAETGGTMHEMLIAALQKHGSDEVSTTWLKDFLATNGKSATSYNSLVLRAQEIGYLKNLARGRWRVVRSKLGGDK